MLRSKADVFARQGNKGVSVFGDFRGSYAVPFIWERDRILESTVRMVCLLVCIVACAIFLLFFLPVNDEKRTIFIASHSRISRNKGRCWLPETLK